MRFPFLPAAWVLVVSACVVLGLLAASTDAALAAAPIRPHQHFHGLVNGGSASPIVYTVCPGPASLGRTGPVASGQEFSVARAASGGGATGPFSQVYAWFVQNAGVNGPLEVGFKTYRTKIAIPSEVRVPCDGRGQVEFSSCPHLAPCAFGWVPTYVGVRYINIAA